MIAKTHRWQKTAMAAAAIALLGLSGTGAYALSLGRLTVQSALGEPLRAEIEVPDITPEEAATLKAAVAPPEAFLAAGLEYSPVLTSLQASLQRRAEGQAYLSLTSERTVNDPFVDVILEATWASGRIVRDYTLLLDPPNLKKPAPAPTLAQTSETSPTPQATPTETARPAPPVAAPAPAPTAARAATPSAKAPAPQAASGEDKQITVKQGDTASKIALVHKPAQVSLDQMLVALLRSNPEAFVNDNLNRMRAGAVMTLPSAESANSISPAEASKIVVAHLKDFNDFRRNLAGNAPQAAAGAADRKASGSLEAQVNEKKPATSTPDKLTLSKGAVSSKADEASIAKEREAQDRAAREAELEKNTKALESLKAAANALPAHPAAPASAPGPVVEASTPQVAAASAPAVKAPDPAEAPVPAHVEEDLHLLDTLLEDPLVPAGAVGLLALLGGFAAYRIRQRKKKASQMDSVFLESRLQPDSFFGASGGQQVNTNQNDPASGSSMAYSASQMDAVDDVDPVAEADVYLAYGRDLQAEEILKEAALANPGRLAIHNKLLEIFAKRRDTRSFEKTATQAYPLTGAPSPEWARICEMGQSIDPTNPLYQADGIPTTLEAAAAVAVSGLAGGTVPAPAHAQAAPQPGNGLDLDLDLDFSLDDETAPNALDKVTDEPLAPSTEASVTPQAAPALAEPEPEPEPTKSQARFEPVGQMPEISLSLDDLDMALDTDNTAPPRFEATSPGPVEAASTPAPDQADNTGLMEFDLSALSLEPDKPADLPVPAPDSLKEDPLGTKLALAEEFISIGDEDGARALLEEVMSEATGEMRAKAQQALAQLN